MAQIHNGGDLTMRDEQEFAAIQKVGMVATFLSAHYDFVERIDYRFQARELSNLLNHGSGSVDAGVATGHGFSNP